MSSNAKENSKSSSQPVAPGRRWIKRLMLTGPRMTNVPGAIGGGRNRGDLLDRQCVNPRAKIHQKPCDKGPAVPICSESRTWPPQNAAMPSPCDSPRKVGWYGRPGRYQSEKATLTCGNMVEPTGLEPVTPCLQSRCATNCAKAPCGGAGAAPGRQLAESSSAVAAAHSFWSAASCCNLLRTNTAPAAVAIRRRNFFVEPPPCGRGHRWWA